MTAERHPDPEPPETAARRVAEFARAAWLSLSQVAREAGGRITAFTLTQEQDETVIAEAEVVTAHGARYRHRFHLGTAADGPPVEIAVSLFVTGIEEDLLTGGSTTAERVYAARRALERHQAAAEDDPGAQSGLAAALRVLAARLSAAQQWDEALATVDQALEHYRQLAEQRPSTYTRAIHSTLAAKASILKV